MLRVCTFCLVQLFLVASIFGQGEPGGGGGTGDPGNGGTGDPECYIVVHLTCVEIAKFGGPCGDSASHSCLLDPVTQLWGCKPDRGILPDDYEQTYSVREKVDTNEPGWLTWSDPTLIDCGYKQRCNCNLNLQGCKTYSTSVYDINVYDIRDDPFDCRPSETGVGN